MKTQLSLWNILRAPLVTVATALYPSAVPARPHCRRTKDLVDGTRSRRCAQLIASPRRRLELLTAYVILPLAILLFGLALLQRATGIDYTDYISGHQIMYVPR